MRWKEKEMDDEGGTKAEEDVLEKEELGNITHLIHVPDSDNLVFLWTMSYSLWTM